MIVIVLFAIFAGLIIRFFLTVPAMEGFAGAARGAGHPDCLRTLPGSAALLDTIASKLDSTMTEGRPDYNELELILSKMACLKKDLMSPSGVVDSTRYQAFETAHDRMAVAELCGMCMSKNVSPRDLDLVFMTWRDRGTLLLRRLCTAAHLSEAESADSEKAFLALFLDVYDVSKSQCLKTDMMPPSGGEVSGYFPENLVNRRTYDFKYGGLSASGANGAV